MSQQPRTLGILIFDDVEVLDFAGPLEVFSVTGRNLKSMPFHVFTVTPHPGSVLCQNGLSVNPRHTFLDCPTADILVIPGGWGTRKQLENAPMIEWIRAQSEHVEVLLSVCTGALLLGKAGLLDGLDATTHFAALDLLKTIAPKANVFDDRRVLDNGKIVVAAGVSAGIDASLHIVARLLGRAEAVETARYIEYDWKQPG